MKQILLAALLAAFSDAALAGNVYAGGSIGYAHASLDCAGTTDCGKEGASIKGLAGYRFKDTYAAEIAYFNLNDLKSTLAGGSVRLRSSALDVRGLAFMSVDQDAVAFAALGASLTRSAVSSSFDGARERASKNSLMPLVALGIDYSLTLSIKLRSEIEARRFKAPAGGTYSVLGVSFGLNSDF